VHAVLLSIGAALLLKGRPLGVKLRARIKGDARV